MQSLVGFDPFSGSRHRVDETVMHPEAQKGVAVRVVGLGLRTLNLAGGFSFRMGFLRLHGSCGALRTSKSQNEKIDSLSWLLG